MVYDAAMAKEPAEIARLRVTLDDVTPQVVRRIEVPVGIRLDDLHFVLQVAIGWQNGHPFEFRIGDLAWGLRDRDLDNPPAPAEQATLADLLARARTFAYDYVFGEDWQHTVELETIGAARAGVAYPHLVSAEGRCPPADIGGPSGYETYLRAIADPRSIHHDAMTAWDDARFDPGTVDIAALRKRLADLARYVGRAPVSAPCPRGSSCEPRSARSSG
jgi:hypothetical protein